MDKKSNMKKAMYEMFGVGGDGSEAASTAPTQVKSASVEVKSASWCGEKERGSRSGQDTRGQTRRQLSCPRHGL
ncbi:MAG: hypothetical protein ACLSHJ_08355 [Oscillospiraceae bacterium]